MHRRYLRPVAVIIILLLTVIGFIHFFATHPSVSQQLHQTSPAVVVGLLVLYFIFMVILGLVFQATLVLCRTRLKLRETILVTMYSSIINFFGPLQSGPAFRAVYLKRQHGVKLKDYTLATALYYLFYAAFSGLMLLSGILKWWLLPLVVAGILLAVGLLRWDTPRLQRLRSLNLQAIYFVGVTAALQVAIIAAIFFVELHAVNAHITLGQALIYTGAANFALFVSITPGAIGFRESFVLFSQRLHHIDSASIVAANLLDRSVYIVMLLLLLVLIFATHAGPRLNALRYK